MWFTDQLQFLSFVVKTKYHGRQAASSSSPLINNITQLIRFNQLLRFKSASSSRSKSQDQKFVLGKSWCSDHKKVLMQYYTRNRVILAIVPPKFWLGGGCFACNTFHGRYVLVHAWSQPCGGLNKELTLSVHWCRTHFSTSWHTIYIRLQQVCLIMPRNRTSTTSQGLRNCDYQANWSCCS